jgi:hypothetical protein
MDDREPWHRIAVAYLLVQALAVVGWWTWLLTSPDAMRHFIGPRLPAQALRAYLLPDLVLYGGVGLITAALFQRDHPLAWPCLLLLAGGILYATLATIALAIESGGGWIGIPLMTASATITLVLAWRLRPR